ncbi:MAG: hypothetical protein ACJZ2J_00275 [Candidatus Poseidoniales archaeon]
MSYTRSLFLIATLIFISAIASNASADADDFNLDYDNPGSGEASVDPEQTIEMSVLIENVVENPMSFEMKILNDDELQSSGIEVWWSHNGETSLTSKSDTIPKVDVSDNSVKNGIVVSVEATENAVYGDYEIEVRCNDKDSDEFEEISLSVAVNEKAEVTLELSESEDAIGSVDIDNQTTYEIQVNNNGNKLDTFTLTLDENQWDTEFEDSQVTIEAFTSQIVILTVTTENNVDFGDLDSVTITATSQNDPSVDDTLSLTTQVRVKYGLIFATSSPNANSISGEPGSQVSFNFKLINKWSESVNYEVNKKDWYRGTEGNRPDGWSESSGTGTLDGFQETNSARLTVTISSGADAGEVVTILVEAIASDDQGKGESIVLEVEVRVEGNYNVQLLMPGTNEISVNADQLVPISSYIKVKNLAKVNDLIYVTAEWELGGNDWILETPEPISLASNAEKALFISVKAPKADAGGQATLKIRVESGGDSSKSAEQNIIFRVNTAQDSSGPQTEELGEESDFPVDPIWIVSIVLIIGLGSSAAFLLNQRSKGAFGSSGENTEDYSDEWAGMEAPPQPVAPPPAAAPPQPVAPPPAAAPPQPVAPPPAAAPPQPVAPPPAAAPPQPEAPPAATPPQPEAPPAAAPTILTITVPQGVMAGQQIQIKAPSGQLVNVKVPEGCGPGSQFKIQI